MNKKLILLTSILFNLSHVSHAKEVENDTQLNQAYIEVQLMHLNNKLEAYKKANDVQIFLKDLPKDRFSTAERKYLSQAVLGAKFPEQTLINSKERSITLKSSILGISKTLKIENLDRVYDGVLVLNGIEVNIGIHDPSIGLEEEFARVKQELKKAPWDKIFSDKKLSLFESFQKQPFLTSLYVALSPLFLISGCSDSKFSSYFKSPEALAQERGLAVMGHGWYKNPVTNKYCFEYFGKLRGAGCENNNTSSNKNGHI